MLTLNPWGVFIIHFIFFFVVVYVIWYKPTLFCWVLQNLASFLVSCGKNIEKKNPSSICRWPWWVVGMSGHTKWDPAKFCYSDQQWAAWQLPVFFFFNVLKEILNKHELAKFTMGFTTLDVICCFFNFWPSVSLKPTFCLCVEIKETG